MIELEDDLLIEEPLQDDLIRESSWKKYFVIWQNKGFLLLNIFSMLSSIGEWLTFIAVLYFLNDKGLPLTSTGIYFILRILPPIFAEPIIRSLISSRSLEKKLFIIAFSIGYALFSFALLLVTKELRWILYVIAFIQSTLTSAMRICQKSAMWQYTPLSKVDIAQSVAEFSSLNSMLLGAGLGGLLISWSGNIMKLNFILDGSLHIMCALIVLLLSYLTKRHPHMARKEELIDGTLHFQDTDEMTLPINRNRGVASLFEVFSFLVSDGYLLSLSLLKSASSIALTAIDIGLIKLAFSEFHVANSASFGIALIALLTGLSTQMGPVIVDAFGQINLKQSHWMIITGFIIQNIMLYLLYWSPTAILFYACIALRGVGGSIISAKSSALLQIATPESLTDRIIIIENIIRVLTEVFTIVIFGTIFDYQSLGVRTIFLVYAIGFSCTSLLFALAYFGYKVNHAEISRSYGLFKYMPENTKDAIEVTAALDPSKEEDDELVASPSHQITHSA